MPLGPPARRARAANYIMYLSLRSVFTPGINLRNHRAFSVAFFQWILSGIFQRVYTVSCHNFKSQNFKLSVSNPKNKYVAYLSVLSQISNCQGLGSKHKHEILKTDRMYLSLILSILHYAPARAASQPQKATR